MRKSQLEGIRRAASDLIGKYDLIITRIKRLCADFDSGELIDEAGMALQLRMLFFDLSGGRSVMNQLGVANRQKILSTLPQAITHRTILSTGFLGIKGEIGNLSWFAGLDESQGKRQLLTTERWLEEIVLKTPALSFDRGKIIRVIADKEGGSHLDPEIDPAYYEFAKNNGLGWVQIDAHGQEINLGDPFPHVLRQMCYEVLKTDQRFRDEGFLWSF